MSFDMGSLMKQAQKVQERMREIQEELANERVEAVSGGGMVTVVATGQQEIIEVKISDEALQAGAEMVSDMVLVAINDAIKQAREIAQERIGQVTGGLNLPGLGM
jgi:DNA-binding YbaB/EbfC family protein